MTKSKFYLIALVTAMLLSVVLCSSPSFAAGTSSTSQTEATITIPLTQWNELKSNNRSTQYNIDIGNRIDESKNAIHEARSYLKRNVELIDRIEGANRERQTNNQTTTAATQPISASGSGSSNRSSDSSVKR